MFLKSNKKIVYSQEWMLFKKGLATFAVVLKTHSDGVLLAHTERYFFVSFPPVDWINISMDHKLCTIGSQLCFCLFFFNGMTQHLWCFFVARLAQVFRFCFFSCYTCLPQAQHTSLWLHVYLTQSSVRKCICASTRIIFIVGLQLKRITVFMDSRFYHEGN